MMRFLHITAITALIASAAYVYGIKYDTLYYSEEIAKLSVKIRREHEAIAIARAEWALLTRPERLQRMADKNIDLQPMSVSQMARFAELPVRPAASDAIGRKLESLGLETSSTPTATPRDKKADDRATQARTPVASRTPQR